ncbi:MAG TPA: sigma-70 family RNA polymerase sigma factor [Candidatus Sulfotelmatobacter sp.]|nr:sigma-70 family RNA polymerase sigma factor [Candidatus Sulfotelmatobacter sp.]
MPVRKSPAETGTKSDAAFAELYAKSRAAEFDMALGEFVATVDELARKNVPGASEHEKQEFCSRLHIEDLVLARACAHGNQRAWELFMGQFREKLYDAARQITRDDSTGRELADSVYADLYGTQTRAGQRVSKLSSYGGRGSLAGWLRTVLAQEYINHYRKQRRLVSLDRESEEGAQFPAAAAEAVTALDERLEYAVDEALRALAGEDRFVLASYFLDERTLAEIARALSVHESTISRKVEKLTKIVRKQIFKSLMSLGMSRRQAEEALSADVRDLRLDIRASLAQDSVANTFTNKEAKAGEGGR